MIEVSDFKDFILPPADQMATTVTDSLNYQLEIAKGQTGQHALHSSLTAAGIDATSFPTEVALTTDGPDGVGANAMVNEAATFTDTRKVVASRTSPLPLLHATTLQKITIHLMPDPIHPRFIRINRVPKLTLEEDEVLPPSLSHTPKPLSTAPTSRPAKSRQLRGPSAAYPSQKGHAPRDTTTLRNTSRLSSLRLLSTPAERML
jgi:hypothetical protein